MNPELRITQLKVTGKRAVKRVQVELSDGRTLELDPELVVAHSLRSGEAVAEEALEALAREDEALRARRRLTGYLALRVKSTADARFYLQRAGFSEPAIEAALAAAADRGLLDDRRFAESLVRTRLKVGGPQGPLRLLAELVAHGIENDLAESILAPQFDPEWQREAAEAAARKRLGKQRLEEEMDRTDAIKKLYEYLKRQGYEYEIALEAADRAVKGRY